MGFLLPASINAVGCCLLPSWLPFLTHTLVFSSFCCGAVFGRRLVQRIANLLACHAVILQEHLQGYKLPQVWEDLLPADEVLDLMRTTCNRPLKIVNKISREVGRMVKSD